MIHKILIVHIMLAMIILVAHADNHHSKFEQYCKEEATKCCSTNPFTKCSFLVKLKGLQRCLNLRIQGCVLTLEKEVLRSTRFTSYTRCFTETVSVPVTIHHHDGTNTILIIEYDHEVCYN
uniref:Cnidarian restricted protein n=1 Tax=Clytia hemisphaerica TaxID=252671 RepID=A0A7M6DQH8_9CNID